MGELQEAMSYLTEEIIGSQARSQYPYVLIVGPCARYDSGQAENAEIGIYAKLTSEAFGDIGSASDRAVEGALVKLCRELQSSRAARQLKESKTKSRGKDLRTKRSAGNRAVAS